jgi:enamine deaminase RidA (YjgF/YER057c/UK114 family)
MSISRYHIDQRMSQIITHGGTVYLAGQVANDFNVSITIQTEQVLQIIDALLGEVGSDKSKILSAQIWLANIGHYAEMNQVWDAWVPDGSAPARACIEARPASPDWLFEIGIVATQSRSSKSLS